MNPRDAYGAQFEVLDQLEPRISVLMEQHQSRRTLWFSSDFLPASEKNTKADEDELLALRERAKTLPDAVRVCLDLNLRTEEGLPHFHRIISIAARFDSQLGRWNNLWTAEEDRHGNAMRDYVREARIFDLRQLEVRQFDYLLAGFQPAWVGGSPYEIFVYTTVQEKATQISHDRTGCEAGNYEPTLQKILRKIAEDEARHHAFYLNLYNGILEYDPNGALVAASEILPHIDMPGVACDNFRASLEVEARLGIYSLWDYKNVVERAIRSWKVREITGLKAIGAAAQEKILGIPARLEAVAKRVERSLGKKSFSTFDVIYGREFALDAPNVSKP